MTFHDRLSSKLAVRLYIIAASAFVLLFVLDAFVLPWIIHSRSEIAIPDLTGMPRERAVQVLADQGLQSIIAKHEPSEKYPPEHVVYQDPPAKSVVREGRNVYLTLSGGGEKVTVPNLRGRSLRDVKITLEQLDLRVGMISYVPSQLPMETVLSQTVPPGRLVSKQSAIDVSISSGEDAVEVDVPYVVGMSLELATDALKEAGLAVGAITYKPARGLPAHSVLEQHPASGEKALVNSTVALTLVQ